MIKLMTLAISSLILSSTAYASTQGQILATWVNDKNLSLNDIVKNSENFDNNMTPNEGITCIRKDNNTYINLVHPNSEKKQNTAAFTEEENKVLVQIFTDLNGKTRTEGVPVFYSVNNMNKEGMAYLIDKDSFCMAYEVISRM